MIKKSSSKKTRRVAIKKSMQIWDHKFINKEINNFYKKAPNKWENNINITQLLNKKIKAPFAEDRYRDKTNMVETLLL